MPVKEKATDRAVLADRIGKEFEMGCKQCGRKDTYHVNRVDATVGNQVIIGAFVAVAIGIVFTKWLWDRGFVATLSFVLPVAIVYAVYHTENAKVKAFNSYRVGE